jgi:hypothetical protein
LANLLRVATVRRDSSERLLVGDIVLALNQATRIVPSGYVAEPNVVRQGAEERNSISNEHRYARDNEALNEPRAQELLNRDPAVDIDVAGATRSELRDDVSRRPGHLFNNASARRGQVNGTTTQDHHALVTIGPRAKGQNLLEGLATDHNRIDACNELVVAVGFAAALGQKIGSPFGRAMKPSTLVPIKIDTVIGDSSPADTLAEGVHFSAKNEESRGWQLRQWR